MTTPKIQALGITQPWSTMSWNATSYVDGVGWLEAWGTCLIGAMEALQTLTAQRVAQQKMDHDRAGPRIRERLAHREGGDTTQGGNDHADRMLSL